MNTQLDLITIGRVSVDLYGQQIGTRLEDVSTFRTPIIAIWPPMRQAVIDCGNVPGPPTSMT